ncbi:GIY-YIG nuclease family protein [Patescibacteria group bacterium]|nr:GIY-YIG nuclease family protein [Patescibacteria group bacterium]MBU1075067.1 GIY-YIG nuclease family protein [Patescibacteria group bacterium]MBU1951285.1 GIY-YIG nuclease family protein [Patescibacteria group bacterium]
MKKSIVYLLYSEKDLKTYLGSTTDIERRLVEHNRGKCTSTRNRRPVRLIYKEEFDTITEARAREKYYKSHAGRKALHQIFIRIIGE